ncbi:MAG: hypothetical protein HY762_01215, partial [Planctomycetes bacterium]|nr:hypothetical protein [Planctomycetota bacterium]
LSRKESHYRKVLEEHKEEISRWFNRPPSYPPDDKLREKYDWNYQGIRMLDEAVQNKALSEIEAEVLAEHICYEQPFLKIAQELNLTAEEVINHYETGINKLRNHHR